VRTIEHLVQYRGLGSSRDEKHDDGCLVQKRRSQGYSKNILLGHIDLGDPTLPLLQRGRTGEQ